ncbi:MAG: VWA domain-containing protein [Rhizobiaceae bacterium]
MVAFGWPWALLLLLLPLLLRRRRIADLPALRVPPSLQHAFEKVTPSARKRYDRAVLLWLAWLCFVLALSQPSIVAGQAVRPATGRAIALAVDLSSSMERRDFVFNGETVDRLTAFKSVANTFIERRDGDRLALVLFGDQAFAAAPLSYDVTSIANALQESAIGMAGRATAIGDAIGLAIIKLRDDPAETKAIVLMSDGTSNAGTAEPEDAARLARTLGINIHTIGLGSEKDGSGGDFMEPSADLDERTLLRIAEVTDGRFFRARTTEELAAIFGEIDRMQRSPAAAPPVVPRIDVRNWLLLPLMALLALIAWRRARPVSS